MEKKTFLSGVAAFGVVGLIATGAVVAGNTKRPSGSTQVASSSTSNASNQPATAIPSSYKDGTYMAKGKYTSPDGVERIDVTIVVANSVVTDTTVKPEPASYTSKRYQGWFLDAFKPMVVGKQLSKVMLGNVSGSSLTPIGFNDALKQIRNQAKA